LCNSNYFYTPILKIEETYSDNYDFVVPETHSFVSQGFINHNTLCTAIITADINKPTIIYVIGLDLLKQFHDLFSSVFDEPIGFIGDGVCDIHRINIASIWTVSSALKVKKPILQEDEVSDKELAPNQIQSANILALLQKTKVHIFDESHVVTTDTIKSIFNKIDPEYIFGFSGTPFRDDGSDLLINGILGDQIINVPASQLITDGYLAQPIIKFVRVPKTYIGSGTSSYQTVYKEYVTENIIRNKIIIENTKELLNKNYQTLVLFKHLQHGKNLRELFDAENINYEYLSGNDALDKRLEVKERLLSKKSNLVLASSIFDIGVDIPSLSALVLAGGGKSSIRTLQRVGRVIRKNAGKKYSAIVDFYDDIRYLKSHTKIRYKIYKSEDGFRLIIPKNIMDLK
jgi:superfamily II DNA or RNA helicase